MSNVLGILFGLLLTGIGIKTLRKSLRLRRNGRFVIGTVTRRTYPKNVYVSFLTTQNHKIEFLAEGGSPWLYNVGDQVAVLYDPYDPRVANIYTWDNLWSLPIASLGGGILFILFIIYQSFAH
jgi:hypothetical protein